MQKGIIITLIHLRQPNMPKKIFHKIFVKSRGNLVKLTKLLLPPPTNPNQNNLAFTNVLLNPRHANPLNSPKNLYKMVKGN